MARFWNKYDYTDFHELNIGWCIDKITEFEARLTDVEEDVADLKTRMTSVEGRMTTAEERIARHDSDIAGLSAAVGGIRDRVTTLENADIQDAVMLESVSSVQASNTDVTVNFNAAAYNDGVKTAGTEAAVIPAASASAAGVMLPGEKQKLSKMTLSGDNVTFAGKVSGAAATSNSDFVTKQYVDSLAIGGSATGAYTSDILSNKDLTKFYSDSPVFTIKDYAYGLMHEWVIDLGGDVMTSIASGSWIAKAEIASAIRPKHNLICTMEVYDQVTGIYFDGVTMNFNALTGQIIISNSGDGATTIPGGSDGAELSCYGRIVFVDVAAT